MREGPGCWGSGEPSGGMSSHHPIAVKGMSGGPLRGLCQDPEWTEGGAASMAVGAGRRRGGAAEALGTHHHVDLIPSGECRGLWRGRACHRGGHTGKAVLALPVSQGLGVRAETARSRLPRNKPPVCGPRSLRLHARFHHLLRPFQWRCPWRGAGSGGPCLPGQHHLVGRRRGCSEAWLRGGHPGSRQRARGWTCRGPSSGSLRARFRVVEASRELDGRTDPLPAAGDLP